MAKTNGARPMSAQRRRRTADAEARRAADEVTVEALEERRDGLRSVVRSAIGFDNESTVPLAEGIRLSGMGWYPMIALGLLIIVDQFQSFGFTVLGPEIADALGLSKSSLAALLALKTIALTLAALPMAAVVQHRARRGSLAVITGLGWGLMTLCTGFVVSAWGLLFVLVADGGTSGSVVAIHEPLLVDTYPPNVRVRALSFYRGSYQAGSVIAPLIVGVRRDGRRQPDRRGCRGRAS